MAGSGTAGAGSGRRRESLRERRERRGTIDDPEIVLNAAGRYLEALSRSVEEVRRHLTGAGYRSDLVEEAVARLVRAGMLDDEAFARTWVESRDRARPRGEAALRQELARKGIARDVVAATLARRREGDEDEPRDEGAPAADEEAARRLLARRASALARVADPRARRQRAYALLARNGFDPEVCRTVAGAFGETRTIDDDA
jgi:regulatory protein